MGSLQSGHDISTSAMQRLSLTLIPGLLLLSQVQAWGGVFNRYNPSLHSSYYDTSGNYYNLMTDSKHHVEEPRMVEKQIEELLEEEEAADSDPCHKRKCTSNEHCCDGMVCVDASCSEPAPGLGKFGEECRDSSDCNIHQGLCCRLTRRPRMQPKKLCTYFTDADLCIGNVATHQIKRIMEHTAGEKRMSAHPDHEYLRYK